MKKIVSCDSRGNYQRDCGWKRVGDNYRQHRFYLGRDRSQAAIRSLQLDEVWKAMERRWERDRLTERPLWDVDTLAIAQAVARGEHAVTVTVSPLASALALAEGSNDASERVCTAEVATVWLFNLRQDFPMVEIHFSAPAIQSVGTERLERAATKTEETARFVRQASGTGQSLHQALDAFADFIRQGTVNPDDKRVSPYGRAKLMQVAQLKEHSPDMPLSSFDLTAVEAMLTTWKNRPVGKRGLLSPDHCRNCIKRAREFIRWLHRSPAFDWRKPADYEVMPLKVAPTKEERAKKLSRYQVATYSPDDLATLYEHATPPERLYMLLALNCGFGAAEVGSLALAELDLKATVIRRLRHKSDVYGEWALWPETLAGLRWWLARRPASDSPFVLLTERGQTFTAQTQGGNRRARLPNLWSRLYRRIVTAGGEVAQHSFNKLRKTAGDLIRQHSDGETAGVFLCHGQPVRSDTLADVYTNRDFSRVFKAQEAVRATLAGVFSRVPDPFPTDYKRRHGRAKKAE